MKKAHIIILAIFLLSVAFLPSFLLKDSGRAKAEGQENRFPHSQTSGEKKQEGTRVERIDIDENVHKYHEDLELVAFAPGSGWLQLKTRNGISPIISFFSVTEREIQKFNEFSEIIGAPIRISITRNVLRISAEETDADLKRFSKTGKDDNEHRITGFYRPGPLRAISLRKDPEGNIFIVNVEYGADQSASLPPLNSPVSQLP